MSVPSQSPSPTRRDKSKRKLDDDAAPDAKMQKTGTTADKLNKFQKRIDQDMDDFKAATQGDLDDLHHVIKTLVQRQTTIEQHFSSIGAVFGPVPNGWKASWAH